LCCSLMYRRIAPEIASHTCLPCLPVRACLRATRRQVRTQTGESDGGQGATLRLFPCSVGACPRRHARETILLVGNVLWETYSDFASVPLPSSSTMLASLSMTGSISGVAQVINVVTPGPCPARRQSLWTTMPMVTAPWR